MERRARVQPGARPATVGERARRFASSACLCVALATVCGCLDATTVVFVKKDGSGTVTETILVREIVVASAGTNQHIPTLAEESATCRQRAETIGRGVVLQSIKQLRDKDAIGFEAVYAFDDVRELTLDQQPDLSLLGNLVSGRADGREPIRFEFAGGNTPTLTVNIPKPKAPAETGLEPVGVVKSVATEQKALVRKMFKDFRVKLLVTVDGKIGQTTASFFDQGTGNMVTIFSFDLEKLLGDDRLLEEALGKGRMDDINKARIKLDGVRGMKLEKAEQIEIKFK